MYFPFKRKEEEEKRKEKKPKGRAGHTLQGLSDFQPLVPYKSSPNEVAATIWASIVNIFLQILDTGAEKQHILYTLKGKLNSPLFMYFSKTQVSHKKIYQSSDVLVIVSR